MTLYEAIYEAFYRWFPRFSTEYFKVVNKEHEIPVEAFESLGLPKELALVLSKGKKDVPMFFEVRFFNLFGKAIFKKYKQIDRLPENVEIYK